ncbi:CBS domain-containing protein [Nitrospina watsonii]|uniref:A-adding tRNA nucleotidyltransferase n=1 Tax=Nitrospina watsonii TaxID=1323948 RepID=A0ABM9HFA2_9BACT|nr:CBS domain-containing protein [Nitrospina watsonii]CAI2718899.1 A-adding tRNA nucleotidyltransferase [Nitrospina watsonii]
MEIITTHISADFDCVAAMVATQKLYPDAHMAFSSSMEKSVQEYLHAFGNPFQFTRAKDVDLTKVTRLIVVDTQDAERIGVFKSLLNNKNVEVHVYDHHMDVDQPLRADQAVVRPRGSAATVLCEELAERGITLSALESTLVVLGIYQDTHSLMSSSTTPEDFYAVGRMVAQGADLNIVADFAETRLNQEQRDVMKELIVSLEVHNFNGVEIALAQATVDYYVGDLAVVVSRMMELENLKAVFGLVCLDHRVYVIGRSRTEEVNVGRVLSELGGGGHTNAASASTRDLTPIQAREKLIAVLNEKVEPLNRIQHVMHAPVVSVQNKNTIAEVENVMTRFNLNTLPVLANKKPVGLVTRQVVEKAIHHKLAKERVEDFMAHEFSVTTPDAYFKTIVPSIIEAKQKLVPVVHPKTGHLVGIVSRGDLLRLLHQDMGRYAAEPYAPLLDKNDLLVKNVKSLMKERLPKTMLTLLDNVSRLADETGLSVYVVGGFVRDLLLRIENLDLDIVVEGNGIQFARKLGKEYNGRVVGHEKFGTSVVLFPDGSKIDVATARMEYYQHPAALPTVEMSSIKSDLFRRDFTFNALAIKLNGKDAFTLIDYFNGQRDLKDGVVRVLHNLSFVEDPCRAFRAVRFEQRLGFHIGKQTESFLKRAVDKKLVDKLSGTRLYNELMHMLEEKTPIRCFQRMKELGLLQTIHPRLMKNLRNMQVLERIEEIFTLSNVIKLVENPDAGFMYFLGMLYGLKAADLNQVAHRLSLPAKIKKRVKEDIGNCESVLKTLRRKRKCEPSDIYNLFAGLSTEALLLVMAVSGDDRINKHVLMYFTQYNPSAALSLTGDDLIEMGIRPGPVFQTVFKALRDARINGQVHNRDDEVALVEKKFLNGRSR